MKTFLFHGQAGSGKDTQVEKLLDNYPIERIATGEMFRKMDEEGDPFAVEVYKKVKDGIWPTPEETYTLFEKWVKRYHKDKIWILVSAARYAEQIPYLDHVLEKYGRKLDKVIHFTLSEEKAIERIAGRKICPVCQDTYHPKFKPEKVHGICDNCGNKIEIRDDDTPEGVKKRFAQYAKSIEPWVEVYKKRGIIVEIDASPSIEEIHNQVVNALELK